MCGLSPACEKRRNGCNARLKSALRRHHAEIIVTRAQPAAVEMERTCVGDGGALSTILTQNRYALYLPLRAAPSAMHRQIGRTEKAHLDVRFVASMRETQKRLQRTPQKRLRRHPLLRSSSPVRSLPQLSV